MLTTWGDDDDIGWREFTLSLASMTFIIDDRKPLKAGTSIRLMPSGDWRPQGGWRLREVTGWKLEGCYKLTVLTNICLPPTHRVYKEITCSPRFIESKGIPTRKGPHKIYFKEIPKTKRLLIRLGDVHALLL